MNDHESEFDHHAHEVGPEIDDSVNPTESSPHNPDGADAEPPRSTAGREMLTQLQQMIDTVALQAGPAMREVAAKAAELAAVAAEKAGPVAHKAAEVTESVSGRIAARSKEVAADLRRPQSGEDAADAADAAEETPDQG